MKLLSRPGTVLILCLFLLLPCEKIYPLDRQAKVVLYNINFGAVVGGVGALINKPDGVKWYKAFLLGCVQGACGGFFLYEGKNLAYLINGNDKLEYGWLAKLVHATGVSFIENAASGRYFWETWNMHVGPVRIETFPLEGGFRLRLLPYATGTLIAASCMGDFYPMETVRCGTPYFGYKSIGGGGSLGNELLVNYNTPDRNHTVAHEYIHVFQQREWTAANGFFLPLDKRMREYPLYETLSKYIYLDIPYFYAAYQYEGRRDVDDPGYYNNYFEMEADGFAENFGK